MTSLLAAVTLVLDHAKHPIAFFLRNDDVGWRDDRLFPFLDLVATHRLPLDLAVIPAALEDETAHRLLERCTAEDGRLRVHQHGWRHVNHERAGRKCEFGDARAAEDQATDLRAGRERLGAALGPFVDPIFTPPWNRCAPTTARLLTAESYRVLSRDVGGTVLDVGALVELPVVIDWQENGKAENGTALLEGAIAYASERGLPVGIMIHHAAMDAASLAGLGALLDLLARHENARCLSMMACAAALSPGQAVSDPLVAS